MESLSSLLHWQVSDIGLIAAGFVFGWTAGMLGKAIRYAIGILDSPNVPPSMDAN